MNGKNCCSLVQKWLTVQVCPYFGVRTPLNPIPSFYAAVARKTLAGLPEGGYEPAQRMTRAQALRSYTIDAAYAEFEEDYKGSIEPGKAADFTVFTNNIMQLPEADILSTKVAMTIIDGEIVYEVED